MRIEWWYWIIAGFGLIGLELVIPSFTIIWFGIGAVIAGALSYFWPDFPLGGQIAFWLFVSICFTAMWFKYLKPNGDRANRRKIR